MLLHPIHVPLCELLQPLLLRPHPQYSRGQLSQTSVRASGKPGYALDVWHSVEYVSLLQVNSPIFPPETDSFMKPHCSPGIVICLDLKS